jgi:hypothetical protein
LINRCAIGNQLSPSIYQSGIQLPVTGYGSPGWFAAESFYIDELRITSPTHDKFVSTVTFCFLGNYRSEMSTRFCVKAMGISHGKPKRSSITKCKRESTWPELGQFSEDGKNLLM